MIQIKTGIYPKKDEKVRLFRILLTAILNLRIVIAHYKHSGKEYGDNHHH